MPHYSKEQILQLYRDLPEELKSALNAEETIDTIEEISNKHKLSNEEHTVLVDAINYTMMGLLPPNEFSSTLENAGIKKDAAEEINKTVRRFIFYPVRKSLDALYDIPLLETAIPPQTEPSPQKKVPKRKDSYREKIE